MRAANKATIVTSQLPVEHWHAWIGDATIANAILDRIMQKNHRFNLTGESLRPNVQTTILRMMPKSLAAARSHMASTMMRA
jgi:DNA replication protein DnaC